MQATELLRQTRDPESRSAMVLFSDGHDTVSIHSLPEVLLAAQNLQSAIYALNTRPAKSAAAKGDAVLYWLAADSGGLSFDPGQNVKAVLQTVLDDLRSGYVLTYEAPVRSSGQHSVRILPTGNPQLHFRSRSTYNDSGVE